MTFTFTKVSHTMSFVTVKYTSCPTVISDKPKYEKNIPHATQLPHVKFTFRHTSCHTTI